MLNCILFHLVHASSFSFHGHVPDNRVVYAANQPDQPRQGQALSLSGIRWG